MGTIIKDLVILNEDNFYLTKQSKKINNEYNIIGKSYNKKEKYKTQETNYELSLEYILNKSEKEYFFNLLNNNNYFLYKRKENFLCDLVYKNNITTIYIDINNSIFNNINVFNYDLDNRLYLLINNKKYSFFFDESYDYQLNNKYRLVDEISLNTSSNLNNTNAELLDICILVNNNIKFKFLTDKKYNLTFDIETINNIITSLSINNTITPNLISELSYNELYGYYKSHLYTKLLKLENNHYLLINVYSLHVSQSSTYGNDKLYCYISYKKIYLNNLNEIEKEDEWYSLIDFNNKINIYDFNVNKYIDLTRDQLLSFLNFNVIKNNNEIYLVITSSSKEGISSNYKVYDSNLKMYVYKKNKYINNIITNDIEYLKYEISEDKLNIIDYKKNYFEYLSDYKQTNRFNESYTGLIETYNEYQSNIHTNIYMYNNLLYISNFVNSKITNLEYNKSNNNFKVINNNQIYSKYSNINYNNFKTHPFGIGINLGEEDYNFYYRAKEDNIDYNITNKSNFIDIHYHNMFKYYLTNENNLIENNILIDSNINDTLLFPAELYSEFCLNKLTIQKILTSNNKKIFINKVDTKQYFVSYFDFNNLFNTTNPIILLVDNNNVLKKINKIKYLNGIKKSELNGILLNNNNRIYFYYNTINNTYNLLLSRTKANYLSIDELILLEFNYDDNETINITKKQTINIKYSNYSDTEEGTYSLYFDESNRKYYIYLNQYKTYTITGGGQNEYSYSQFICLNEDFSTNFNIKDIKELNY